MLKEDGDSYDGLLGLLRTTPFAPFSEVGWYPRETSGERISRRIDGLIPFTRFHIR